MFKFIHAADVHLDSPLCGLDRYDGAPVDEIRQATRRAFQRLVDLALEEHVAFVVLAGDIYDGEARDFQTALFFNKEMSRLREHGVQVYVVAGNHDADARMRKKLARPSNVHVLATSKAETCDLEELGVAIHGQGFAKQAVTEDLVAGYPPTIADRYNIGILHTSLDGREGHDRYAPCTVNQLLGKGYDYWALGHVHKREIVHDAAPVILFPGNLQGRHIREEGPKGCMLVSVEGGQVASLDFRDLDVFRWGRCNVTVGDRAEDVLERFAQQLAAFSETADDLPMAVRVTLSGGSPALRQLVADQERWLNEVRSTATDSSSGRVWVEKVIVEVPAAAGNEVAAGVPDELLRIIEQLQPDMTGTAETTGGIEELARRLQAEMPAGWDGPDLRSAEQRRALAEQGRALLLARLHGAAGEGRMP